MRGCLCLQTKYAHVTFDNQLDTSSPSGKLVFNIIGAVAEFEREIIRERVRAGLANARQKGKILGRTRIPRSDLKEIISLKNRALSNRAIGRKLSIFDPTPNQSIAGYHTFPNFCICIELFL